MDRTRMNVLKQKARAIGLSDREADELGRLLAEAQEKAYSNTAQEHPARTDSSSAGAGPEGGVLGRLRRRWTRRPVAPSRSLEIGLTSAPPEDAERQDEPKALSRR